MNKVQKNKISEIMNSINQRKSIRKYADREVTDELLTRLLQEAEHTPTMGNLQLYSVVVTRSREMKEKLAPAHFNQPMVTGAPVVLTFCADFRRTSLGREPQGRAGLRQSPQFHQCRYRHAALLSDILQPC